MPFASLLFLLQIMSVSTVPLGEPEISVSSVSYLMHYSVANYCPSTADSTLLIKQQESAGTPFTCPMIVNPAVALFDPRVGAFGRIDRCADFDNDQVSRFKVTTSLLIKRNEAAYYMGVNEARREIIVSFRGSQSIRSVLVDAQFYLKPAEDINSNMVGQVHSGFADAYISLQESVSDGLDALVSQYPSFPITFTGHSLGGSMSVLAATDYLLRKRAQKQANESASKSPTNSSVVRIVTFGEPRSGDKNWARFVTALFSVDRSSSTNSSLELASSSRHLRIVHQGDIIPSLPPRSLLGYYHSGVQIQLLGSYKRADSYRLSVCDRDLAAGNGESLTCGLDLTEEDGIFSQMRKNKSLMNLNIVRVVKGLVDSVFQIGEGAVKGFVIHITEYFGFFTYPPNPLLSISFTC